MASLCNLPEVGKIMIPSDIQAANVKSETDIK